MRHDGGVHDAETLNPVDPECRIDNCRRVHAHLAGAAWMEDRDAVAAQILLPVAPRACGGTWGKLRDDAICDRRGCEDSANHLAAQDQRLQVTFVIHQPRLDPRRIAEVARSQLEPTATVWPVHVGN